MQNSNSGSKYPVLSDCRPVAQPQIIYSLASQTSDFTTNHCVLCDHRLASQLQKIVLCVVSDEWSSRKTRALHESRRVFQIHKKVPSVIADWWLGH